MRLLITGSGGQLGGELVDLLRGGEHDVVAASRSECDVTDAASVRRAMDRARPGAVVNCAAYTAVDAAESARDAAFAVNAHGAAQLAEGCAERGAVLCHVSTDFVFDGSATAPIPETARPHPINVYGESKLAGEEAVRSILPDAHLIVRSSWLYGRNGPNFVLTMLRLARERDRLRVVADQVGSPTWTGHLAPAVLRLLEGGRRGTFHVSNGGAASWHGFAAAIIEASGLRVPVDAITTADYPTAARRPAYSVLENARWRGLGEQPLPGWRSALPAYLATRPTPA